MKKPKGALEKRIYRDYRTAFEFYVMGKKKNGRYPIYRWVDCLNGPGEYTLTIGNADWVEQSKIIKKYKGGAK